MWTQLFTRLFRQQPATCIVCQEPPKITYYFPLDTSKREPFCEDCFCDACMFDHYLDEISKHSNAEAQSRKEVIAYLHAIEKQGNQHALVMLKSIVELYGVQL